MCHGYDIWTFFQNWTPNLHWPKDKQPWHFSALVFSQGRKNIMESLTTSWVILKADSCTSSSTEGLLYISLSISLSMASFGFFLEAPRFLPHTLKKWFFSLTIFEEEQDWFLNGKTWNPKNFACPCYISQ